MKTKEEIIREAYGEHYDKFKDSIDENGWTEDTIYYFLVCEWHPDKWGKARPKSLEGIENNNGWKRIESEEDLPNEDGLYFAVVTEEIEVLFYHKPSHNQFWLENITHYQPIVKPKHPIF